MQTGTGLDRYAGWALVVAYRDTAAPARNLTVFDGFQSVSQNGAALQIPVSGFVTPATGPVRTRVGFVAYEGDRGATADRALLNGTEIADAADPAGNFFNSAIAVDAANVTTKAPDQVNQLGFDATLSRADGLLGNGVTAATIELRTMLDQFFPGVISFATELPGPRIAVGKTVENASRPGAAAVFPGETLRYAISYANTGDDAGEAGAGAVRFPLAPLGTGATATVGFDVTVGTGVAPGTAITNVARAEFVGEVLGVPDTAESPPATMPVAAPTADLQVIVAPADEQTALGRELEDTVTVINAGREPAPDAVLAIASDERTADGAARTPAGACDPAACALGTLPPGGSVEVDITRRPVEIGSLTTTATVTSDAADPSPANTRAARTTEVVRRRTTVDTDVAALRPALDPGETTRVAVSLVGEDPAALARGRVCARVPAELRVTAARGARRCGRRWCWRVPRLAPGECFRRTATLRARPGAARVARVRVRVTGANLRPVRRTLALRLGGAAPRPRFTG